MVGGIFLSLGASQRVSVSGTSAVCAEPLISDKIAIWSTCDCFITFGTADDMTSTTAAGVPIPSGTWLFLQNPNVGGYIAGICVAGVSGTLNIINCN